MFAEYLWESNFILSSKFLIFISTKILFLYHNFNGNSSKYRENSTLNFLIVSIIKVFSLLSYNKVLSLCVILSVLSKQTLEGSSSYDLPHAIRVSWWLGRNFWKTTLQVISSFSSSSKSFNHHFSLAFKEKMMCLVSCCIFFGLKSFLTSVVSNFARIGILCPPRII